MDTLVRDLRFAWRSLLGTPALTAAAVFSIGLAIAATTSVFSIVDAALFRAPPFVDAGRLAILYITRRTPGSGTHDERWSWARSRLVRDLSQSFEQIGSFSMSVLALTSGDPEPLNAEMVSSSYFSALRIRPEAGRILTADEDAGEGEHPVVVLGYDFWRRRFGGNPALEGRTIALNGVTLTVIGVLPRGFAGLTGRAQVWVSATMAPRISYAGYLTTNQNFISVVGRLKPGISMERAQHELAIVGADVERASPNPARVPGESFAATAVSLNDARIDPSTRSPMLLLLGAAGCLLLLCCANVASLLLGRAVSRRREMAIRLASGASRGQVVRQLLTEAGLLAAAGGIAGVIATALIAPHLALPASMWGGRNFYGALGEFATPRLDVRVIAFAIALCAATALAFGLVPALRATRVDLTTDLKDGAAGAGLGRHPSGVDLRKAIIVVEVALALVLLASGGLLSASYRRLQTAQVGFDRAPLLTFLIRPSELKYPVAKAPALLDRVLAELKRIPGVEGATVDGCAPTATGCASSTLFVMGRPAPRPDEAPPVLRHYVGPDHFRVLGVPLTRGRAFNDHDRAGSPRVTIISETAAHRFWPNEDPIGQRVWFGGGSNFDRPDSSAEIVGIVGDIAYQPLDEHPFQPDFYTPYAQFTYATRTVIVRTRGDPGAIVREARNAVRAADPELALFEVRTMEDLAGDSWARHGYQALLLGAFALAALLIAAIGIFAVIAHFVAERRREIGIRVALGARSGHVLASVVGKAARPAVVGLALGTIAATLTARLLRSLLYGVAPLDPVVFGGVIVLLGAVVSLAAYVPARRALGVDPAEVLRS